MICTGNRYIFLYIKVNFHRDQKELIEERFSMPKNSESMITNPKATNVQNFYYRFYKINV